MTEAVTLSGLPCVPKFDVIGEPETLKGRWERWLQDFELFCAASGVSNDAQKRALLLHCSGEGIRDIYHTKTETERGKDDNYAKLKDCLNDQFKLRKCTPLARQNFLKCEPSSGETVDQYVTRLKTLAKDCEFGDTADNHVRDRLLLYVTNKPLCSKLYAIDDLTLSKTLETIRQFNDKSVLVLKKDSANFVGRGSKYTIRCWNCSRDGHKARDCRAPRETGNFRGRGRGSRNRGGQRGLCSRGSHGSSSDSGLRQGNSDGLRRSRRGNSNSNGRYRRGGGNRRHRVRQVERDDDPDYCEDDQGSRHDGDDNVRQAYDYESDSDYYAFRAHLEGSGCHETFDVKLQNVTSPVIIDSGATCNLMSKRTFDQIAESNSKLKLRNCNSKVYTYGSDLPMQIVGKCALRVEAGDETCIADFIVVPGSKPTLLGRFTSEDLNMLRIGFSVNSCSAGPQKVTTKGAEILSDLRKRYPEVFTGLGKLKNYKLKLHIDENVRPVAQHRRTAFHRRAKVRDKLGELYNLDVIERVTGPTSWVNPLVTVEKPNGDIRLCLDMRLANQAVKREKHPVPTVEETLQEISGAKVFCKLDLKMAFHQIELDEQSRDITTFAGPDSLWRYKRLIFGINMATEKFQSIMSQVLKGCPGAHNIHDDIRIVAENYEQLAERVEIVIQRLKEHGLTLNYPKCEIGESMIFMGHKLTGDGVRVAEEKVKAITEAPTPTCKAELRSFLGLAQFCAKYVKNFAIITSPLWDLTGASVTWNWAAEHEKAFRELKHRLTTAPVMAYFRPGAKTRLVTDGSPVGVGAILEQQQQDGSFRPVYYASRKLSHTEQRYSQFERECLAVKWACEKFRLYLVGTEFQIRTDHKPLLKVLSPNSKAPSARVERWLLFLQDFKYSVVHIAGKSNYADVLSRLPVEDCDSKCCENTEDFAYSVVSEAVPSAMKLKLIETETKNDPMLRKVESCILSDDFSSLKSTPYWYVKTELWLYGHVIMRGDRVVIPQGLRQSVLKLAHEGHQGIVRTKARLRSRAWWPGVDHEVEKLIQGCYPCQLVGSRPKPEPLRSTKLPEGPWFDIATDLLEVTNGQHLLVVTDYYSRWPEVVLLRKTDSSHVTRCLESIFQTHGIPYSLRSDNGPPFNSGSFEAFLDYLDIEHKTSLPYLPQSNGCVERMNESILKIIRIAKIEGRDWRKELENYLFQYRNTPHAVTGVSPAQALMGRDLRDKLPKLRFSKERPTELDWQMKFKERDALNKLRSKQYADERRNAEVSDLKEGEKVLLKKAFRQNKLEPTFELEPYTVVSREGTGLLLENSQGTKYRATSHVKRFVESKPGNVFSKSNLGSVPTHQVRIEDSSLPEVRETNPSLHSSSSFGTQDVVQPVVDPTCSIPDPSVDVTTPCESVGLKDKVVPRQKVVVSPKETVVPAVAEPRRSGRVKSNPAWFKDYKMDDKNSKQAGKG